VVIARRPPGRSIRRASESREQELDVAYVLQRLGAEYEVEGRVSQRQRGVGLELDESRVA